MVTPRAAKKRVRVLFVDCPRLDTFACSYLILAQNSVQDEFEFWVQHYWIYVGQGRPQGGLNRLLERMSENSFWPRRIRHWAYRKFTSRLDESRAALCQSVMQMDTCIEKAGELLRDYDKWITQLKPSYGGKEPPADATIIVTEAPFEGGYYANAEGNVAVISVAYWQSSFAPPSVLEFILSRIQRYTARICFNSNIGSHYSTKACIWDFNANVADARAGVLVGYLCQQCEDALSQVVSSSQLHALKTLAEHQWIGRTEEPGSVASNLRRIFGYDLARTKGLSGSAWGGLVETGSAEVIKNVVKIGVYVAWAGFLGWLVVRGWLKSETLIKLLGK